MRIFPEFDRAKHVQPKAGEMTASSPDWKSNESLAVGKGAIIQEFSAIVGNDKLEIDVAAWGEGHLRVNGLEIAHINDAKNRRQAFRDLKEIAERYLRAQALKPEKKIRGSVP
jgi:hypothetical protein